MCVGPLAPPPPSRSPDGWLLTPPPNSSTPALSHLSACDGNQKQASKNKPEAEEVLATPFLPPFTNGTHTPQFGKINHPLRSAEHEQTYFLHSSLSETDACAKGNLLPPQKKGEKKTTTHLTRGIIYTFCCFFLEGVNLHKKMQGFTTRAVAPVTTTPHRTLRLFFFFFFF